MSPEFVEKLLNVNRAMGAITKDKRNDAQRYGYISADQIANKFRKACLEQGLVTRWDSDVVTYCSGEFEQNGKLKNRVVMRSQLVVSCALTPGSDSEDYISSDGFGEGVDGGDKATMKAVTVSRKYAIMGLMQLAEGNDPEADTSTDEDARASSVLPRILKAYDEAKDKIEIADIMRRAEKYSFSQADAALIEKNRLVALKRVPD